MNIYVCVLLCFLWMETSHSLRIGVVGARTSVTVEVLQLLRQLEDDEDFGVQAVLRFENGKGSEEKQMKAFKKNLGEEFCELARLSPLIESESVLQSLSSDCDLVALVDPTESELLLLGNAKRLLCFSSTSTPPLFRSGAELLSTPEEDRAAFLAKHIASLLFKK